MIIKNDVFTVEISDEGYISRISVNGDSDNMNFVSARSRWGKPCFNAEVFLLDGSFSFAECKYTLVSSEVKDNAAQSVYTCPRNRVTVSRFFNERGNLTERYEIYNYTDATVCFNRDTFGIELHPNDEYSFADECMTNRCTTHIWCGENSSWVNFLKMGNSPINLGLALTNGALVSYSQRDIRTNHRGYFILEPESVMLAPGECYTIEWEIFTHNYDNFFDKLKEFSSYIGVTAEHFTVFDNEKIRFTVASRLNETPVIGCDGSVVRATPQDDGYRVEYTPARRGEHTFNISVGGVRTYARFNVKAPFNEILENRMAFMVKKQQCLKQNSRCYGAFLIYDNKTESQYFDFFNPDHNACRERLNMALLLARYLQIHKNDEYRRALDLFVEFVFREFFEESTGEVFNTVGKIADQKRLYNSPGVMLLFAEVYKVTGERKLLDNIMKLAENYYSIGGHKCYSNAVAIKKVTEVLKSAGEKEKYEKMLSYFKLHTDTMIEIGTSYPKHEVNFEQTIVTPAVTCISEMGIVTGNGEYYAPHALKHLEILKRFSGMQPDYRLNEIAVRFWDDFWFGKGRTFGDTLPHHLSVLSARAYYAYYLLTGDEAKKAAAEENLRNCLCLIEDDGHGHAASIYPRTVNGNNGEFFDGWANDQDLVLYDWLYFN